MFIEQPAKWLRWLYPKAIWRMDKKEHSVYLTFDDGPIPESTPIILEILRKYNVKATFFMVGENVLRHHDLYNQIVKEGHQVGNHTFNHIGAFKHRVISYVLNTNTMKFHYPSCSSVDQMKEKNKEIYTGNREDIINMGYMPCKRCNP